MESHTAESTSFIYGLLRHGETEWNSEKRVQGHGNSSLTAHGREQISEWATYLADGDWQHILCSDLGRVQETVAILNDTLHLPVTIDKRLREQHWGDWEGMRVNDVYQNCADELARQIEKGWDFRPPEGESRGEVRDRVLLALAAARENIDATKLLVVCHLGVIKCLVYHIAGRQFHPDEPSIMEKGCFHHIRYSSGVYHLDALNIRNGQL